MGWETDYYDLADCPCGAGKIVRAHHSPDNGWSRSYDTVEIGCSPCSKWWDVEYPGSFLVEKHSQTASRLADAAASAAGRNVMTYLNSLLPSASFPTFKTMGAEFDYLHQAGLCHGTVGQYRYARRTANMRELAEISSDSAVIPKLVKSVGDAATYDALLGGAKAAQAAANAKADDVERIKIPRWA